MSKNKNESNPKNSNHRALRRVGAVTLLGGIVAAGIVGDKLLTSGDQADSTEQTQTTVQAPSTSEAAQESNVPAFENEKRNADMDAFMQSRGNDVLLALENGKLGETQRSPVARDVDPSTPNYEGMVFFGTKPTDEQIENGEYRGAMVAVYQNADGTIDYSKGVFQLNVNSPGVANVTLGSEEYAAEKGDIQTGISVVDEDYSGVQIIDQETGPKMTQGQISDIDKHARADVDSVLTALEIAHAA